MSTRSLIHLSLAFLLSGGAVLADEKPAGEEGVLTIGSVAPALDVEHWVSDGNGKFKPVTEFEDGKIYIVEFWATWCGPCISSMPHLVELQNTLADDGVQIVSISREDMDTVNKFLDREYVPRGTPKQDKEEGEATEDEPVTYGDLTSAYCLTTDPDASCHDDYMKAAGQNGIPCCFLVGKTGHVEWIGHPMAIDSVLKSVIADKWDRDAFAEEFIAEQRMDLARSKAIGLVQEGDFDGAVAALEAVKKDAKGVALSRLNSMIQQVKSIQLQRMVAEGKADEAMKILDKQLEAAKGDEKLAVLQTKFSLLMNAEQPKEAAKALEQAVGLMDDPMMLNQMAWSIYEGASQEEEMPAELVQVATSAAEKAVKADPKNAAILDTLAHLIYLSGDLERAIEIQTKAVENQDPPNKDISDFLKKLKKEAAEGKDK